ncbi:hypothetical protein WICPIJ_002431 [Wickerhamomyces pijperi]|uniref:Uncharacterized protein n=1 Tax=Wickerhamomyces pijperi TaxID=599730 RepID=A0A9P8Q9Q6_WICPI|nr:hypothetical protein WICPIJ_002431 [Wickerhamomyces pijperi]
MSLSKSVPTTILRTEWIVVSNDELIETSSALREYLVNGIFESGKLTEKMNYWMKFSTRRQKSKYQIARRRPLHNDDQITEVFCNDLLQEIRYHESYKTSLDSE